jgi:hypothetical protein
LPTPSCVSLEERFGTAGAQEIFAQVVAQLGRLEHPTFSSDQREQVKKSLASAMRTIKTHEQLEFFEEFVEQLAETGNLSARLHEVLLTPLDPGP